MHADSKRFLALCALGSFSCMGSIPAHSADLPLDYVPTRPPVAQRATPPAAFGAPVQPGPSSRLPNDGTKNPVKNPATRAPGVGWPVVDHDDTAHRAMTKPAVVPPATPEFTGPSAAPGPSYLVYLALIILAMIGLFSLMASVPRLLRAIDRLFEPAVADADVSAAPSDPFAFAASPPEMSVEDVRREIETLRAMKEQLDAQAEAARAAVRQARAQHQQKEDAA